MSESVNIFKSSIIYAIGNFGSKVLSLALVSLFSFYLTKEEYGIYDFIITSATFLVPIITLQIGDAAYRELFDVSEHDKRSRIISSSLAYFLISYIVVFILLLLISRFFNIYFLKEFLVLLFFSCLFPFLLRIVRGLGKTKLYAISGILLTFLLLLFSVFFLVKLEMGINGLLLASILSHFFTCLFLFIKSQLYKYLKVVTINSETISRLLKYSWPLVPSSISWFLITISDRFIILFWLDMDANGIFSVSTKYPGILITLNYVFYLAVQDHALNNKFGFNSNIFNSYVKFNFTLVNILILITPFLTKFILSKEFFDAWKYTPLLYISTAYMGFASYIEAYYVRLRDTKGVFYTTIIGGITNLIVSGGLMPFIGLYAPALGSLLGFLIMFVIRYNYVRRRINAEIDSKAIVIFSIISFFCLAIIYVNNFLFIGIALMVSILLFSILNKNLIQFIIIHSRKMILRRT